MATGFYLQFHSLVTRIVNGTLHNLALRELILFSFDQNSYHLFPNTFKGERWVVSRSVKIELKNMG